VICPKCGEDNSDTFRFCGMCGTLLETRPEQRRPLSSPVPVLPVSNPLPVSVPVPRTANATEPRRSPTLDNAIRPGNNPTLSISGPSMLGLDQPALDERGPSQPSVDSLREKSFSGLDSFFEPEPPRNGRRIMLLVALLAALGGAGWWTYTNYLGATESRKPETVTSNTVEPPAETPSTTMPATSDATPEAKVSQGDAPLAPAPSAVVPEGPSENANPVAVVAEKPTAKANAAASTMHATRAAPANKTAAKRESSVPTAKASKAPTSSADTGDADFRKAEAYLYGRGERENCDEAVKSLKAASAKSNAKARSTFGTMYATGHCVPRDLPTSYLWFAMALRVDPNNQILEKDLSAVWNQMTPPERQTATRMKQ
jgi:hypothetical protein